MLYIVIDEGKFSLAYVNVLICNAVCTTFVYFFIIRALHWMHAFVYWLSDRKRRYASSRQVWEWFGTHRVCTTWNDITKTGLARIDLDWDHEDIGHQPWASISEELQLFNAGELKCNIVCHIDSFHISGRPWQPRTLNAIGWPHRTANFVLALSTYERHFRSLQLGLSFPSVLTFFMKCNHQHRMGVLGPFPTVREQNSV